MGAVIFHDLSFGDIDLTTHFFTNQLIAQNLLAQVLTVGIKLQTLSLDCIFQRLTGHLVLLLHIEQSRFNLLFGDAKVESFDALLNQSFLDHT